MPKRRFSFAMFALAFTSTLPAPCAAQTGFDVGALFATYRPMGSFEPASIHVTSLPTTPGDLNGNAWGGEGHLWFGQHLGLALDAAVASSTIGAAETPDGPRGPVSAQVSMATAQLLYNFLPAPMRARLWLSAGPGLVRHGGDAYASYGDPTQIAGAAGLGASMPLVGHLSATAGVTSLFYFFDLPLQAGSPGNSGSLERGKQLDVLAHVGLTWGWN